MNFTRSLAILLLLMLIAACDSTEKDWNQAESLQDIQSYRAFLEKHPDSELTALAKSRIKDIRFESARQKNSVAGYFDFLRYHPSGSHASLAREAIESIRFSDAQSENSVKALTEFLEKYPSGIHADSARNAIETIHFESAKSQNTIPAYKNFLSQYPDGVHAVEASEWLESVKPSFSTAGPQNTKYIKIEVEQSYGVAKNVILPFFERTKSILEGANFRVSSKRIGAEQGELTIQVTGTPLSKEYAPVLYTGARIRGRVSFTVQEEEIYGSNFNWVEHPPNFLTIPSWQYEELKQPEGAPFKSLFESNFYNELGNMVVKLWGDEVLLDSLEVNKDWKVLSGLVYFLSQTKNLGMLERLLKALQSHDKRLPAFMDALSNFGEVGCETLIKELLTETSTQRANAAMALGRIKCQDATMPLIEALGNGTDELRFYAVRVLYDLTGKSFGENQAKWLEWWNGKGL